MRICRIFDHGRFLLLRYRIDGGMLYLDECIGEMLTEAAGYLGRYFRLIGLVGLDFDICIQKL
jgi:hypothetical protein